MPLLAQPGSLDVTFNPTDQGFWAVSGLTSAIAYQPDGKILIAGRTYFNQNNGPIIRLNPDGSLDPSFSCRFRNENINAMVCLPDGKIMVGGWATWTETPNIARLNSDGSIDGSFNTGTGADGSIETIAIQPDGKVLIGGAFTNYNGNFQPRIARLNPDGTIDKSFKYLVIAIPNHSIFAIAVAPDGKLLVGDGGSLVRLNPDGSLDENFRINFPVSGGFGSFVFSRDGKVLVGGSFVYRTKYGEARHDLMRLDENGSLDETFKSDLEDGGFIQSIFYQLDGKLLIINILKCIEQIKIWKNFLSHSYC